MTTNTNGGSTITQGVHVIVLSLSVRPSQIYIRSVVQPLVSSPVPGAHAGAPAYAGAHIILLQQRG